MNHIWISALAKDQARVSQVATQLQRYGLKSQGHFWLDEPAKVAERVALDALLNARADGWLILVDPVALATPSVRYGLSLMAAGLQHARPATVPMLLWADTPPADADAVPPILGASLRLNEAQATWPAKLVAHLARQGTRAAEAAPEYRLDVWGDDRLGQWLEIGPTADPWEGIIFGVAGCAAGTEPAQIDFQAVGPRGALPQTTVLEYAQQGLTLQAGGREFTGWALRNRINAQSSYYARVRGCPQQLLFLPYAQADEAQATIVSLV